MSSKKILLILVVVAVVLIGGILIFKSGTFGSQALWDLSRQGKWLLPLVTIGALIDSINPCAFSILILTIAFLLSLGRLRSNILEIGASYIFGIFVAYILIGLGLLNAFHIFNIPGFMGKLGAILIIILGLINLLQAVFPTFPIRLKIPKVSHHTIAKLMERASIPSAFLLGAVVGICEFPCTGGPYLMVIGLLHDAGNYTKGLVYLFYYNLLFILPLVIILLIAGNKALLNKVEAWQKGESKNMRWASGLIMIILGIVILLL